MTHLKSLEQKVNKAVELINRLREENSALRAKLKSAQPRIQELETALAAYKQEQEAVEKGILTVLAKLDKLEDEVSVSAPASKKDGSQTVLRSREVAAEDADPSGKETAKPTRDGGPRQPPASPKDELDIF
jgi:septal ring factor EnvC (AmiA/AmiB activator)